MRTENAAFISFDNQFPGVVFDDSNHENYPITYYNVHSGEGIDPQENCSYFGFIYEGIADLTTPQGFAATLKDGSYYSHSGLHSLGGCYKAIVIEVYNEKGMYAKQGFKAVTTAGGPIESKGRLKYIDGCTDSLLIAPVKKGDPCLNHLHFPIAITQTAHTHPSHRIGIVAKGEGLCVTPFGKLPLTKGMIFVIKEYNGVDKAIGIDGQEYEAGTHCFFTYENSMDVIAFHPDSDFGPEDENHPMINRTIVGGVSANRLDHIKTK